MRTQKKSSLVSMLITMAIIIAILFYLIMSLNTGDLLWFWPVYDGQPSEFIVHCYGEDVVVNSEDAAFSSLNAVVNKGISGKKWWDSLSLSDVTYQDYQDSPEMMVLEIHYEDPQLIHSFYRFFKKFDQLLIPLDGRHAEHNLIFGLYGKYPEAGSLHIRDISPIIQVVEENNLCKIQSSQ